MTDEAERIIVNVTGIQEWRPLFELGLVFAFLVAFAVGFLIAIAWWAAHR